MSKPDHRQRARRAWPILVSIAQQKGTITYGELGRKLGLHVRSCGYFLGVIQEYLAAQRGIPKLQAVAVNKQTGIPGGGYNGVTNHRAELTRVYTHNWGGMVNPF
jgi:hypothetical protein